MNITQVTKAIGTAGGLGFYILLFGYFIGLPENIINLLIAETIVCGIAWAVLKASNFKNELRRELAAETIRTVDSRL